jgi:hypothetical protein
MKNMFHLNKTFAAPPIMKVRETSTKHVHETSFFLFCFETVFMKPLKCGVHVDIGGSTVQDSKLT